MKVTDELEIKPLPVIVKTVPEAKSVTVPGENEVTCGAGLLMVNVVGPDVPPPGAGFETAICPVPPAIRSVAISDTCSSEELT